jgi:ectoine hydroxylase-related dioxygenase (phytanoyl-CoA dioxygenase family)
MSAATQPQARFFPASESRQRRRLSLEQVRQYNERGYLLGLEAFSPERTTANRRDFDRLLAQAEALGMDRYSIFNYERAVACLWDLVTHPAIVDAVCDVLGESVICWGTHAFAKAAGDEKQVAWHQDAPYWMLAPMKTVTAWIAIDDVDAGNGAMRVIPRSHLAGPLALRQSRPEENNALWLTADGVEALGEPVVMTQRAGQFSLHSDLLVHNSPPNPSLRRRCGFAVRYCTPDVRLSNGIDRGGIFCRGGDPSGHWTSVPRPQLNDITVTAVPIASMVARPKSDFPTAVSR